MISDEMALRLLRLEADRERRGNPGFPPPGLLPKLLAMIESGCPLGGLVRDLQDQAHALREQLAAAELRHAADAGGRP